MPLYRGSPIVSSLRGTINTLVFQGSPHGPLLRAKAHPRKSASTSQIAHRARISNAIRAWRFAPTATRSAWQSYASSHPTSDPLGRLRTPRAFDLFIRYYIQLEYDDPDNPPFPPLLPPVTPPRYINAAYLSPDAFLIGNPESPYTSEAVYLQARITRHGSSIHRPGSGRTFTTPLFLNAARTFNITDLVIPHLGPFIPGEAITLSLKRQYGTAFLSPPSSTLLVAEAVPYLIDDFESGEATNWSPTGTYWTVSDSLPHDGTYSLKGEISGSSILTAATYLNQPTICSLARGAALSYFWYASEYMQTPLCYFCFLDSSNSYYFSHAPRNRYLFLIKIQSGTPSTLAYKILDTLDHSTWYRTQIDLGPGPTIRAAIYTDAGALLDYITADDSTFDTGNIGFQTSNQAGHTGTLYLDDVSLVPSALS